MSHLDEAKTTMKDTEALVRALCSTLSLNRNQIEIHEKAQPIIGYHGTEDRKVGNVIIRKQHSKIPSDVGWEMKDGVLVGHLDTFQYGGSRINYGQAFQVKLTESYNFEKTKMIYEAKGLQVVVCRDSKNRLQLRAKLAKAATQAKIRL